MIMHTRQPGPPGDQPLSEGEKKLLSSAGRSKRRLGPRRPRKADPSRFAGLKFRLPEAPRMHPIRLFGALAAFVLAGMVAGAFWPQKTHDKEPQDDIFFLEEEIPPPPPEPPSTPPDPEPPPPKVEPPREESPLPPQFGLDRDALSETGDLSVTAGNTLMKEADTMTTPPPPPLPPAPVFVDQPPGIVNGEPPEYPLRALDRGLEGTVVVLITIDTVGRVTRVDIEKNAGRDFDEAVLKAVRGTLFQPPVRLGRRVPATFRRPYEFRLEE